MRGFYALIILLILPGLAYSQNTSKIDSLKKELRHTRNKAEVLNELAKTYINDIPEESFHYAMQAKKEALKSNDKKQLGHAMWMIGRYYLLINEYDKSNLYADSARNLYHETKQEKSEINCMIMKANTLFLQGNYEESLKLFENSAKELKDKTGDKEIYCSAILNIGRIYDARGDFDKALVYFDSSLVIAKKINSKYLEANSYGLIGLTYQTQQKYTLAIDNILLAIKIFEDQNINVKIPYWITSLGAAYCDNENFEAALKYCRIAIKDFITINDRWGLQIAYRSTGTTFMKMNNMDSAWIYYDRSLKLCMEINDKAGESEALNYMGEILISREKYNEALEYLNNALILNTEVESPQALVDIYLDMGKCYMNMDSVKKGLDILNRSLDLADSLNLKTASMDLHKELSHAYSKVGSYQKALRHYEAYTTLSDSIFREESNKHFIEMEQKFQSEQREKEISQLKLDKIEKDITIRNQRWLWISLLLGFVFAITVGSLLYRSNTIRKKANDEKEALLKEIHHRVKNNLQVISSLLNIQTQNVKDASVISAVKESQSRVKAMALIHQLLYQEKELTRIDFGTYLPQLIHTISSIFKKEGSELDVDIDASGIAFDIDTSIPLGLIITELVSNAFKYAFDGTTKGLIKVNISPTDDGKYILIVADNGKGLPAGTHIDEFTSMGLRLVKMLTGQLYGTLNYNYHEGAIFTIKFTDTV